MRLGLVVTTYNRPEYLKHCLKSLRSAKIPEGTLIHFENSGADLSVIEQIEAFGGSIYKTGGRRRITECLLHGFDHLFASGCHLVMNLDSDAIVSEDFIEKVIEALKTGEKPIASGFNSTNTLRHPIEKKGQGWVTKRLAGGINFCFDRSAYDKFVRPALVRCMHMGNWDTEAAKLSGGVVCTKPSVVQHIGMESSMGHTDSPDISIDFQYNEEQKKAMIHGKTAYIQQFFGIGDVIFSMQIARNLQKQGYKICWPVLPEFVEGLNRAYPDITFMDVHLTDPKVMERKEMTIKGSTFFVPLRWTYDILKIPYKDCMRSKYDYMAMNWETWREAKYERDHEREAELMRELGITPGESYTLVNKNFRSDNKGKAQFNVPSGQKVVEMTFKPGYSLFDWSAVIENATEIHTVSTSIIYLLELLDLKCDPYLYIRRPWENNHENYDYILQKHKYHLMP